MRVNVGRTARICSEVRLAENGGNGRVMGCGEDIGAGAVHLPVRTELILYRQPGMPLEDRIEL